MRNKLKQQVEENVLYVCVCGVVCGVCVYVCVCACCVVLCVLCCVCVSDVHEGGTSADTTDMPCGCVSGALVKKPGSFGGAWANFEFIYIQRKQELR